MVTTNDLLEKVLADVLQLIVWAAADFDHAAESGYNTDATDASQRLIQLRKAEKALKECFK